MSQGHSFIVFFSGRLAWSVMYRSAMIPTTEPPLRSTVQTLSKRPLVLIAEDDDELRWGLERVFEDAGYDARSFARGDELLERIAFAMLLEGQTPDAVVT